MLKEHQREALAEYKRRLTSVENDFTPVEITVEEYKILDDFAWEVAKAREGQPKYKGVPLEKNHDSFILGICAELAVLKFLGYTINDLELDVSARASDFDHPDLQKIGLGVGVKVSKFGLPHLIKTEDAHRVPEIICSVMSQDIRYYANYISRVTTVYIDGLATPQMLEKGLERDLVIRQDVEKWKDRSGYMKINELIPVENLDCVTFYKI